MKKNVFGNRFDTKKDKYKNLNFENTELIFEDENILILKINNNLDLDEFDEDFSNWQDDVFSSAQIYVVVDFEESNKAQLISVIPNGNITGLKDLPDFAYKFKLKPKSVEELEDLPVDALIYAIKTDSLDINSLSLDTQRDIIHEKPEFIKKVNKDVLSNDDFVNLVDIDPIVKKNLTKHELLRYKKATMNLQQQKDYNEQDLYVFLARDKFTEQPNGMYIKDIDIENLNKIDQYSKEGQTAMAMMQMRSRFQDDVEMYVLWTQKGLLDEVIDMPWQINDDKYKFIRDSIRTRMVKFGSK